MSKEESNRLFSSFNVNPPLAIRIGRKSFMREYRTRTNALLQLAGSLPDRPSASQVHDLRVLVRRIQVMRRLLPREARGSHESARFDLALKSVMKATSQLRDIDILVETLSGHKGTLPEDVALYLRNQRSDLAVRAREATNLLAAGPVPALEPGVIRGKRISRRLRKRIRKQRSAAADHLTSVASDESRVADLHALRKEVKKIRYLMELAGKSPPDLSVMTEWQELLGTIHDLDVATSYLQGGKVGPSERRAISRLMRDRHAQYLRFVDKCLASPIGPMGRSQVLLERTTPSRQ